MKQKSYSFFVVIADAQLVSIFVDLDLSGGAFYQDGLYEFLQVQGKLLRKLNLAHVEEVDKHAFATITVCCPNLINFGLTSCEIIDNEALGKTLTNF